MNSIVHGGDSTTDMGPETARLDAHLTNDAQNISYIEENQQITHDDPMIQIPKQATDNTKPIINPNND